MYKKADRIIAISKSSKNDLIDKFPSIKPNNVLVTYLGANSSNATIQNTKKSTIIRRLKLDQPFVLYVGAVDVRKNIVGMARMFFKLKSEFNTDLKLVMVGKEFTNKLELEELGWNDVVAKNKYRNDIVLPGYVSDSDLEVLYKQARAFVFPSLYEGFGLPILEAMQEGCPVVAFDNSSIPEVAGGAAILANSEDEFIKGVELLLRDNKKRDDLIEAGYKQSKKFSWTKTAKQTIELWGELGRK
jgi:glycosyltransferase involved in cell wall biosynthesis